MTEIRKLARFITSFQLKNAPEQVVQTAKLCVLDTLAGGLGASGNPLIAEIEKTYLQAEGDAQRAGLWGAGRKIPLFTSAFLNSMMSHLLEMDDVHTSSKAHIGTVVVPAAWTLAEYLGSDGETFLEAVICGYETMSRIGMGFGVSSHRNKGWHVTGTAGTFGAAAACSKLLHLDEEHTISALGMAGTQSSGLWAFLQDGASCKILHPARAAASGMEAAFLAKSGMTGPEHILDAEDGGIFPAMSDAYDYSCVSHGLGEEYEILRLDKKPYPCCRSSHGSIDAVIKLRNEYGLRAGDVASVEVNTYLVGYKQVGSSAGSRNPTKAVEARFSTPYTVACALVDGKVDLDSFSQEHLKDPAIRGLLRRVTVRPDERFTKEYPEHWGCELTIATKGGSRYSCLVRDASGSMENPLSADQVQAKIMSLAGGALGAAAQKLISQILQLEKLEKLPEI